MSETNPGGLTEGMIQATMEIFGCSRKEAIARQLGTGASQTLEDAQAGRKWEEAGSAALTDARLEKEKKNKKK